MRSHLAIVFLLACGPGTRHDDPPAGKDATSTTMPDSCESDACKDPCSPQNLGSSYIGCEYYPTVTGNVVGTIYSFAVAIANAGNNEGTITIDGGALLQPIVMQIKPYDVKVQPLPWQPELKLCESSSWINCDMYATPGALVVNGAYRLRSTVPVTVYQFNPLEYTLGPTVEKSTSNDASLLLPTNTWGKEFYVASWEQIANKSPSELVVVAMQNNTVVTITTTADTPAEGGAPAFTRGMPQQITLGRGDALELATKFGDLTGTRVQSNEPVQVFGAHYCANVPVGTGYCDHIEEVMLPVEKLGMQYVVNAPAVTSLPNGKVEVIRILATADNTHLTYNPVQLGAPTVIAKAGEFVELETAASFVIDADQKILVAQYMAGQGAGGGVGDPDLTLAVPVGQFRQQYLFHAPTNYQENYVDITAPAGAHVYLDGQPLTFQPIGATGWMLSRVRALGAGPTANGNHEINGDQPFGISVYGYGEYTSYWYPGGLDLKTLLL